MTNKPINKNEQKKLNLHFNYSTICIEFKCTYIEIFDPLNNRQKMKKVSQNKAGAYVWVSYNNERLSTYVGRSINLFNRVRSYFYPSYLCFNTRVYRYFNKHGFNNTKLIIFTMQNYDFNCLVRLEQTLMDVIKPNLNIELVANTTRFDGPMPVSTWNDFIKKRSIAIHVYDVNKHVLLYTFANKENTYIMKIHHKTLNDCLKHNKPYLNNYLFRLAKNNEHEQPYYDLNTFLKDVQVKRKMHINFKERNKKVQKIYAQHVFDSSLSQIFESQRDCANFLKADRVTIRKYIKNPERGYFCKVWSFKIISINSK